MPNYSQATKMTMASVEEPPYLSVGTDVSAKYKGAFCEAKIIDVSKHVKLRVSFEGDSGTYLINESDLKSGSMLETGAKIEAKHPGRKQQNYTQATVTKILDHSRYTVVFDDGDQCLLRRNSICLKSGKHFAESETLDQLPLTNPEHFGNPVKVGVIEQTHINSNHKAQKSNDKSRGKSSTTSSSSGSNSSNNETTNNEDVKTSSSVTRSEASITHNNTTTMGGHRKRQLVQQDNTHDNVKKIKKERNAATTNSSTTMTTSVGRRGASKGRQRRESVNNGHAKHSADGEDDSMSSSIDSTDGMTNESDVKFDLIEIGVKLMVQYGKGKVHDVYEAKVNKIETNSAGRTRYLVHYTGWNNRYDEWITKNKILSIVQENNGATRETSSGRSKQQMHSQSELANCAPPNSSTLNSLTTSSTSLTSNSANQCPPTSSTATNNPAAKDKDRAKERDKDRDKDRERRKEKEREREKDKERERERQRELELEKQRENEREKEKERQRQIEIELEKQRLIELERQKQLELEKQREIERQQEIQKEREREIEREKEIAREQERQREQEKEREKEKERKQKQDEKDKVKDLSRPVYRFCDDIDESDCDKKISILQERIMALRQTYISLKNKVADLDRRKSSLV